MSIAEKYTTLTEKIPEVYEAGKISERELLWKSILSAKTKTNFFAYWDTESFYPTQDIVITGGSTGVFSYFGVHGGVDQTPINLKQRLEECGVTLDTSGLTNSNYMFNWARVSHTPVIDLSSSEYTSGVFQSSCLVYIEKVILSEEGTSCGSAFSNASALKDVVIEGLIIKSFDIKKSPLTAESAKSIINHLKNYSGTSEELTYTLSLSDSTWTALNESEAPPSGDTWQQYVNSLGYNV